MSEKQVQIRQDGFGNWEVLCAGCGKVLARRLPSERACYCGTGEWVKHACKESSQ